MQKKNDRCLKRPIEDWGLSWFCHWIPMFIVTSSWCAYKAWVWLEYLPTYMDLSMIKYGLELSSLQEALSQKKVPNREWLKWLLMLS